VRKTYQNEEIDTSQLIVPEAVSVALAELAGEVQEGLLALAVGAGLQVLTALMEQDVTVLVRGEGPSRPDPYGDPAWPRCWVGDPGRSSGTGGAAADARQ
jgi:hypothetical protein